MAKRKHRLKVLSTPNPVEAGLKKESLAEVFPGIEAGRWPESSEVNDAVASATVDLSTASAYLRNLAEMDDVLRRQKVANRAHHRQPTHPGVENSDTDSTAGIA